MTAPDVPNRSLPLPRILGRGLTLAWRGGLLSRPSLRPDALFAKAERLEGRRLEGGDWREALERLTGDLERTAELNPLGRTIAHGQIVRLLRQRLRAQRLLERRPDIADIGLPAPVIILGQMRSGTTRLHRMLACDPRFSFTRQHETFHPLARSTVASAATASGIQALLDACNPQLHRIHPGGPWQAEEEFGLHAFSFHGAMFAAQWHVPDFARWDDARDLGAVYAEFCTLLRILRFRRGEDANAIPLLKAPQFLQELDAVLAAFPDARIIRMERDRDQVIASSASLVWHQRRIQSDCADPAAIGRELQRKTLMREVRAAEVLARNPQVPVLTIDYDRMSADWTSEIDRIDAFLGHAPNPAARGRMARIAGASAHHGHKYAPEQFGLAEGDAGKMVDALGLEPRTR